LVLAAYWGLWREIGWKHAVDLVPLGVLLAVYIAGQPIVRAAFEHALSPPGSPKLRRSAGHAIRSMAYLEAASNATTRTVQILSSLGGVAAPNSRAEPRAVARPKAASAGPATVAQGACANGASEPPPDVTSNEIPDSVPQTGQKWPGKVTTPRGTDPLDLVARRLERNRRDLAEATGELVGMVAGLTAQLEVSAKAVQGLDSQVNELRSRAIDAETVDRAQAEMTRLDPVVGEVEHVAHLLEALRTDPSNVASLVELSSHAVFLAELVDTYVRIDSLLGQALAR
jgi:hypothetical protein